MKIRYNAPTILTYTFFCAAVVALSQSKLFPGLTQNWFTVSGKGSFSPALLRDWVSLVAHVAGHSGWPHLVSNFSLILLLGPMLEENYGSRTIFFMILTTGLVTGILNVLFFTTGLLGASGVVFMMILLASFTNFSRGEIPLTFILVLVLYLGDQFSRSSSTNNISYFAHIIGGFCGSLFGFFIPPRKY